MLAKFRVFFAIAYMLGTTLALENIMKVENKEHDRYTLSNAEKTSSGTQQTSAETRTQIPRKWISQLFQEAERNFNLTSAVSSRCSKDVHTYEEYLQKHSVWAIRMMESSQWPIIGVFSGRNYHTGNWRECLQAKGPGIKGRYCLVQATLNFQFAVEPSHSTSVWTDWPDEDDSVWSALKMYEKQPVRVDRQKHYWALCTPSSCTNSDLTNSLNNTLYPLFKQNSIDVTLKVDPQYCQVKEPRPFSQGFFYTTLLLMVLLLLVIWSTALDIVELWTEAKAKNDLPHRLLQCFSVIHNYRILTEVKPNTYTVIYGIKCFYMCLVIYAHRMLHIVGSPTSENEVIETHYNPWSPDSVFDGIVDVFFMISGFMTFHFGFAPMRKGGIIFMIFSLIVRWIRMIPMLGVLMLFVIYILPHLGEGPFWNHRILTEVENCKENWWTNMLAISNIVNTDKQCLVLSYYVAVDIQLAIMGSILLYIISKNKKIGLALTIFTLLCASALTFYTCYSNKYAGHLLLTKRLFEDPRRHAEFAQFYTATFSRVGPYMVGYLAAYFVIVLKNRNFTISKMWRYYVIVYTTFIIGFFSQMYAFEFYKVEQHYNAIENALYATVHRVVFVLPYGFIICLYVSSDIGCAFHKAILSQKIYVPFGRLVYGALLGGFVFQIYETSIWKMPVPLDERFQAIVMTVSDVVFSFGIAFLMYLLMEGPIDRLTKLALSYVLKSLPEDEQSDQLKSAEQASKPPATPGTGIP